MKNILLVGGNFDNDGGRPSKIINMLAKELDLAIRNIDPVRYSFDFFNGGTMNKLEEIFEVELKSCAAVLWFPNVSNEMPKDLRNIKDKYPHIYLVSSKRNEYNEYSFQQLVSHALSLKSNLLLEFNIKNVGSHKLVCGHILDPLGTEWSGYEMDFSRVAYQLINRLMFIMKITRQSTFHHSGSLIPEVPNESEFFEIVKRSAETFHELVKPEESVTRFLGNSSFRCLRGFPSFRSNDGIIFVSRRNVDKRYIGQEAFVPVYEIPERGIWYFGENKPSVDTPIQTKLYTLFPYVNYIIHSHVYVEDAPFTKNAIPCGGLEEVGEILAAVKFNTLRGCFAVNLLGHGNIVCASKPSYFNDIKYFSRGAPDVNARLMEI